MSDTMDRRAQRTRRLLTQALIELGHEREFDKIDVGALVNTAGVGRSTFYGHYASKQDFLTRSFLDMLASMERAAAAADPNRADLLPAYGVLKHVGEEKEFALRFAASEESPRLLHAAETTLRDIAKANLKRRFPKWPSARRDETAVFVAGGFIGLLRWWLESGLTHEADRVHAAFTRLAERAVQEEV